MVGELTRINVSLIGGEHQFLHIVPVAAWLSEQSGVAVRLFTRNRQDADAAVAMMRTLGASHFTVTVMGECGLARVGRRVVGHWGGKVFELLGSQRALRDCDAMLVSERTSALLTFMPGHQPLYIRFTHGVGDREKGFSRKARVFDRFIVAGQKYVDRFVAEGIARPEEIAISGYIKIPALRRIKGGKGRRLFDNARPTVVYNAHFDNSVGSWDRWGLNAIEAILADGRWNLIVAPHMRLFAEATDEERARVEALAVPGSCIVDLGSHASTDMTYIDAADVYLGDVSSQIYEFLADPRPCVFLNAHDIDWRGDENYRHWHLGDVATDAGEGLVSLLTAAPKQHGEYKMAQDDAIVYTLGNITTDTAGRAGALVLAMLTQCKDT